MLIERHRTVVERKINPEIYIDAEAIQNISREDVERTAEVLKSSGLLSTVHAPYVDLNPGARDEDVRKISVKRIISGIELALPFSPRMIVCHPGYFDYNYSFNYKIWLENAYRSFSEIMEFCEKHGLRIAVENVFERNPTNIAELLDRFPSEKMGFCFDPGHANLFTEIEISKWLLPFSGRVFEIHIHDNHGKVDEHLPLGEGNIPFDSIMENLRNEAPIFTLEPHRVEHLERSIASFLNLLKKV